MASLLSTSPSTREQAIERYSALVKKRRDIARKNLMLQTKIAQYVRKNKIDLTSTKCSLENMTPEEEKKEYETLVKIIRDVTNNQVKETAAFVEELSHVDAEKNKIDSKIDRNEEDLEEIKAKVFRTARNSQTNLPIHPELLSTLHKQEIFKDKELRKLRLSHIREQNRLEEVSRGAGCSSVEAGSERALCGTLQMENDLYTEQLDRREETSQDIRRGTAKSIVMISHVAMKLHFVKIDVEKMQNEEVALRGKLNELREDLLSVKDRTRILESERRDMENKMVLLANTKLLQDYKETSHLLILELETNDKLRKCLGQWWEGLQKEE